MLINSCRVFFFGLLNLPLDLLSLSFLFCLFFLFFFLLNPLSLQQRFPQLLAILGPGLDLQSWAFGGDLYGEAECHSGGWKVRSPDDD